MLRLPLPAIMAFILIISSWWNFTAASTGGFSANQLFLIYSYITSIILLQIFAIYCFHFALRRNERKLELIASACALILSVNLFILLLINYEEFERISDLYKFICFAFSIYAFYALICFMFESARIRYLVISIITILFGFSIVNSALSGKTTSEKKISC